MNTSEKLKDFVAAKIQTILSNPSDSAARTSMARLRRGIGHIPGEIPDLWGEYLLDIPEEFLGHDEPSHAEWAIYTAMTMFALHQQSKDRKSAPMHKTGNSLGTAARKLMDEEDDHERVARRFYPVAVASDMKALSYHLRNLVTLLRAKEIPLDYVRLASDLYFFQNPKTVDSIRLRWGEDFCRVVKEDDNQAEKGQ